MRCGTLPTGEPQPFYFPQVKGHPMSGWFKGMEVIIREHRLWPEAGLPAQCKDFKCLANCTDCCCRHLLFTQPDFTDEKCYDYARRNLVSAVMTTRAKSRISHGLLVVKSWLIDQGADVALVSIVLVYHMYLSLTDF
jgi:hypothetical protein